MKPYLNFEILFKFCWEIVDVMCLAKVCLSRLLRKTSQLNLTWSGKLNIYPTTNKIQKGPKLTKILRSAARRRSAKFERGEGNKLLNLQNRIWRKIFKKGESEQRREGSPSSGHGSLREVGKLAGTRFPLCLHPPPLPAQVRSFFILTLCFKVHFFI